MRSIKNFVRVRSVDKKKASQDVWCSCLIQLSQTIALIGSRCSSAGETRTYQSIHFLRWCRSRHHSEVHRSCPHRSWYSFCIPGRMLQQSTSIMLSQPMPYIYGLNAADLWRPLSYIMQ